MHPVTTTDELAAACARLTTAEFITVDTEFMRDSTYWPKLCLVQMAGSDDEESGVLFDPLADLDMGPFHELMANKSVLKVFHACRQDIEILYHDAGVIPEPLFDTQIAAMVCGFGDAVSYEILARRLANVALDKSSRFTDWSRRPLSERQLTYALSDVTHLRTVYTALVERLEKSGRREWVAEEMAALANPHNYNTEPQEAWRRLRTRGRTRKFMSNLMELAAWREALAQKTNVPRGRIMKDDALYEIAAHPPKDKADLDVMRAVPKGFVNGRGAAGLLEAVKRGQERDPATVPRAEAGLSLPAGSRPLVELLKVLLNLQCDVHEVARKLVAGTSDLEEIALDDNAPVPALRGWRREVFGGAALELKHGRIMLGVEDSRIVFLPSPSKDRVAKDSAVSAPS